jgi:hypothetical protein
MVRFVQNMIINAAAYGKDKIAILPPSSRRMSVKTRIAKAGTLPPGAKHVDTFGISGITKNN